MNFIEAVEAMRMGKAVKRKAWPHNGKIWMEPRGFLAYGTSSLGYWELTGIDYLATDWEEA